MVFSGISPPIGRCYKLFPLHPTIVAHAKMVGEQQVAEHRLGGNQAGEEQAGEEQAGEGRTGKVNMDSRTLVHAFEWSFKHHRLRDDVIRYLVRLFLRQTMKPANKMRNYIMS